MVRVALPYRAPGDAAFCRTARFTILTFALALLLAKGLAAYVAGWAGLKIYVWPMGAWNVQILLEHWLAWVIALGAVLLLVDYQQRRLTLSISIIVIAWLVRDIFIWEVAVHADYSSMRWTYTQLVMYPLVEILSSLGRGLLWLAMA